MHPHTRQGPGLGPLCPLGPHTINCTHMTPDLGGDNNAEFEGRVLEQVTVSGMQSPGNWLPCVASPTWPSGSWPLGYPQMFLIAIVASWLAYGCIVV